MDIQLNNQLYTVTEGYSMWLLLVELSLAKSRIAVEINKEILPKSRYKKYLLKKGDIIEIIEAIGGG